MNKQYIYIYMCVCVCVIFSFTNTHRPNDEAMIWLGAVMSQPAYF